MAKKSQEVAEVKSDGGVPAELMGAFAADAGQGVSTSRDDTLIPLLTMVQKGSPEVDRSHARYAEFHIEGIEAGDMVIRSLRTFWRGGEGLVFVPCAFQKEWVEWTPRETGGGMAGRHDSPPQDARQITDAKSGRPMLVLPNGNQLIETRYHFGLILNGDQALPEGMGMLQAVIPLSSTGHTFSRQWMTQIGQIKINGATAPSRARVWNLSSIGKTNTKGSWFGFRAEDRGWVPSKEIYDAGTALYEAIQAGTVRAAAPEQDPEESSEEVPF